MDDSDTLKKKLPLKSALRSYPRESSMCGIKNFSYWKKGKGGEEMEEEEKNL